MERPVRGFVGVRDPALAATAWAAWCCSWAWATRPTSWPLHARQGRLLGGGLRGGRPAGAGHRAQRGLRGLLVLLECLLPGLEGLAGLVEAAQDLVLVSRQHVEVLLAQEGVVAGVPEHVDRLVGRRHP